PRPLAAKRGALDHELPREPERDRPRGRLCTTSATHISQIWPCSSGAGKTPRRRRDKRGVLVEVAHVKPAGARSEVSGGVEKGVNHDGTGVRLLARLGEVQGGVEQPQAELRPVAGREEPCRDPPRAIGRDEGTQRST